MHMGISSKHMSVHHMCVWWLGKPEESRGTEICHVRNWTQVPWKSICWGISSPSAPLYFKLLTIALNLSRSSAMKEGLGIIGES